MAQFLPDFRHVPACIFQSPDEGYRALLFHAGEPVDIILITGTGAAAHNKFERIKIPIYDTEHLIQMLMRIHCHTGYLA